MFYNPTRFVVPLFQRPYVWSKETQWQPLWADITRLIDVINHHNSSATHFLGAIVVQQVPTGLGDLPTWNVIDGQQRLTTIQLRVSPIEWWHSHQGLHPQKCEEPSWDPASSSAKNLTKGIPRWLTPILPCRP
ncbi:DUF262 domain-containing protein [Brevibacterium aurantiacum]|nr:DUF262 domain-containing protein [Brevibacterium aurantiacum]